MSRFAERYGSINAAEFAPSEISGRIESLESRYG
jgi:hypothetical protein